MYTEFTDYSYLPLHHVRAAELQAKVTADRTAKNATRSSRRRHGRRLGQVQAPAHQRAPAVPAPREPSPTEREAPTHHHHAA